jgi:hypothetical protein
MFSGEDIRKISDKEFSEAVARFLRPLVKLRWRSDDIIIRSGESY